LSRTVAQFALHEVDEGPHSEGLALALRKGNPRANKDLPTNQAHSYQPPGTDIVDDIPACLHRNPAADQRKGVRGFTVKAGHGGSDWRFNTFSTAMEGPVAQWRIADCEGAVMKQIIRMLRNAIFFEVIGRCA
jgi:hypothetical protein